MQASVTPMSVDAEATIRLLRKNIANGVLDRTFS
jgi:hypothetical protein